MKYSGCTIEDGEISEQIIEAQDHQHSNSNDNSLQSQSPRPPNPTSTKMTSTSSNSASSGSAGGIGGAKPFKRINSDFHPPPPILSNAYSNDGMGGGMPFPVEHQNHSSYSMINPSVGGGGYYGSYNGNSPRDRAPMYGGYRDPRSKGGEVRRGGEMDQWQQNMQYRSEPYGNVPINPPNLHRSLSSESGWGPYGYGAHRSNIGNPPPPPSGPPIGAVYSQLGQNRPQKSASLPRNSMDYYGPAAANVPPPMSMVGLTPVMLDNTSPRGSNAVGNGVSITGSSNFPSDSNPAAKFVPPLPVKPSPPVRPPPPANNDSTNRSNISSPLKRTAKSADDLSSIKTNTAPTSTSTSTVSSKDPLDSNSTLRKSDPLFNSAIKSKLKDSVSGLRSPGSAASPDAQPFLSKHPPPPVPPSTTLSFTSSSSASTSSRSSSSGGLNSGPIQATTTTKAKAPSLVVPSLSSHSGPASTPVVAKSTPQVSNTTTTKSNSSASESLEKPAANPRSGSGPLIRVITGALSQDEASSSRVFDKVVPPPLTTAFASLTSATSAHPSLAKRLAGIVNIPTPNPVFQSLSADSIPKLSVNEINNLYRPPVDKNPILPSSALTSTSTSALNLLPTSATPLSRSVSAPITTILGEEDGAKIVRRPRAEWGKGLVKRQTSNPEREQPIATSGATDAVEVRVTDESSGAAADISSDNTAFVATAPIIVKQEETKDTDFTKETDTKVVKEKPNLPVKVSEKSEKSNSVKSDDQKPEKSVLKTEIATSTTTASITNATGVPHTVKLPTTAPVTKKLLPAIHTSMIKKTSAIDKAAITKDIAANINGSSSIVTTSTTTTTITAANPTTTTTSTPTTTTASTTTTTPAAIITTATTTAATTAATSTTTAATTTSNSSAPSSNNMSTSIKVVSTDITEGNSDKPEEEEPVEKDEKPVEEGPAKKRKRRSKLQIRLDQEKQEQIQRERELLRLAEEEKERELEREKEPPSASLGLDPGSVATAAATASATNAAINSVRKRKPIAYAVDQAPRKRGRPFGIKSPRHISNQPPKSAFAEFSSDIVLAKVEVDDATAERNIEADSNNGVPPNGNADLFGKDSDNTTKAAAIFPSPHPNPNSTISTMASTVKVRRGGRGRGGRGDRNRALEAQAAAQLIQQALYNASNNVPDTPEQFNRDRDDEAQIFRRIREIYSCDPRKNTLARVFSSEQDQISARKAIQILLDFQSHAVESLSNMNVSYYHLIMENRSLFNTTLMPMPASSDVCSAIDLLDTMIDAMYIQLKDFRAKQYSYEAILNDGKVIGTNGIDLPNSTFAQIFENNQWSISSAHLFSTMITQTPLSPSTTLTPTTTTTLEIVPVSDQHDASASSSDKTGAIEQHETLNAIEKGESESKLATSDVLASAIHTTSSSSSSNNAASNTASVSQTVNEYMTGGKVSYSSFRELESFQPNIDRMKANRVIVTKVIRARKIGKRKAWEELGDRYLEVEQKWCAHVDELERQDGVDQKEGPKLRTASNSMRAFTGTGEDTLGMRSARLSVVGGDSSGLRGAIGSSQLNGLSIARSEYEQDRLVVQERFGNEFRELKIQAGLCDIPDMIQPWPFADNKRAPAPPIWPESVRRFKSENVLQSRSAKQQQDSKRNQPSQPPSSKLVLQLQIPIDCKIGGSGSGSGSGDGENRITPTNSAAGRVESLGNPFTPQQKRYQMAARLLQEQQREREREQQELAAQTSGNSDNQFPEYVHTYTEYLDLNSSLRLTMDGKRQQCSALPVHSICQVHCNCALQVDKFSRLERCWTDMEKCIFVDKFLQYPKNFHKIAVFLKNRTTKDCVKFYYDAKSSIEFKFLLKEFDNRRKNARSHWQYALKCAQQTGAVLYPTVDTTEFRHAIIELPMDDASFTSFNNQPPHTSRIFNFPISTAFYKPDSGVEGGHTNSTTGGKVVHPFPRPLTILHAHLGSRAMCDSEDDENHNSDAEHFDDSEDDYHHFRNRNSYSRSNSEDFAQGKGNADIFSSKWTKHTGKQSYQLHQQPQLKKQGGGYDSNNKMLLGQHYIFNYPRDSNQNAIDAKSSRSGYHENQKTRVFRPSNTLYNTINEYFTSHHQADHGNTQQHPSASRSGPGSNPPQTNAKGSSSKKASNKGRARSSSYNAPQTVVNLTAPSEEARSDAIDGRGSEDGPIPAHDGDEEAAINIDTTTILNDSSIPESARCGDSNAAAATVDTSLDISATVNTTTTAAAADDKLMGKGATVIDSEISSNLKVVVEMEEDASSINDADDNGDNNAIMHVHILENVSVDSGDTNAAVTDMDIPAVTATVDSIDFDPEIRVEVAHSDSDKAANIDDSGIDNAAELDDGGNDIGSGSGSMEVVDTPSAAVHLAEVNADNTSVISVPPDYISTAAAAIIVDEVGDVDIDILVTDDVTDDAVTTAIVVSGTFEQTTTTTTTTAMPEDEAEGEGGGSMLIADSEEDCITPNEKEEVIENVKAEDNSES